MPHNTFLFVLARLGVVGLALIVFCWVTVISRLVKVPWQEFRSDRMASAAVLVTMAGFAFFVLFFERPMNNAEFWIVCAIGLRLAPLPRAQTHAHRRAETAPAAA